MMGDVSFLAISYCSSCPPPTGWAGAPFLNDEYLVFWLLADTGLVVVLGRNSISCCLKGHNCGEKRLRII